MSATSRSRRTVPHSAPAYYLGRPASVWISVTSGHAGRQRPAVVATWPCSDRQHVLRRTMQRK